MLTTIFAMLVTAASPVTDPANGAATAVAAVTKATGGTAAAPTTRKPTQYCIVDTLTGSRIPYKTCKTRDLWMAQGFDPLTVK